MSAVNGAVGRDADKATLAKNYKAFDKLIFTECCEEFYWFLASGSDDFSKRLCKQGFMTMAKRSKDVDDIGLPPWQISSPACYGHNSTWRDQAGKPLNSENVGVSFVLNTFCGSVPRQLLSVVLFLVENSATGNEQVRVSRTKEEGEHRGTHFFYGFIVPFAVSGVHPADFYVMANRKSVADFEGEITAAS